MAHYTDLFSPETYEAFKRSGRDVSGFRERQWAVAQRVRQGDLLICYLTRLSRWFGLLEVLDGPYRDSEPIFYSEDDPFVVRFHVRPLVWLDVEHAVPIRDEQVWGRLSFTRDVPDGSPAWTGKVRTSLNLISPEDGGTLESILREQAANPVCYPLSEDDLKKLTTHTVRRADKTVAVSVPEDTDRDFPQELDAEPAVRESIRIQALVAEIGAKMGLKVWVPRNDRARVAAEMHQGSDTLLDRLPLNYDDTTLRTIEQIDVLWMRGRSIVRAFEVEHTTSIYSGILRMADLLALQPNMDIELHIVAPDSKRDKVFQEIRRPVFSLLDRGPLAECCTFLSYDNLQELALTPHLSHLSDSVLDEYVERAEE